VSTAHGNFRGKRGFGAGGWGKSPRSLENWSQVFGGSVYWPKAPFGVRFAAWVANVTRAQMSTTLVASGDSLSATAYVPIAAIRRPGPMGVNDPYPTVDEHVQYHLAGHAWYQKSPYIASLQRHSIRDIMIPLSTPLRAVSPRIARLGDGQIPPPIARVTTSIGSLTALLPHHNTVWLARLATIKSPRPSSAFDRPGVF
jgi:hypothetical protein